MEARGHVWLSGRRATTMSGLARVFTKKLLKHLRHEPHLLHLLTSSERISANLTSAVGDGDDENTAVFAPSSPTSRALKANGTDAVQKRVDFDVGQSNSPEQKLPLAGAGFCRSAEPSLLRLMRAHLVRWRKHGSFYKRNTRGSLPLVKLSKFLPNARFTITPVCVGASTCSC